MLAGFGPLPDESVLRRLEAGGGRAPRVRLQDPGADPEAPPIAAPVRYQILGEIARGGVGVVLHGRDADLGRDVAMKVLRPEYAQNPEILARFVEEAQVGGQLQHPGIVPVYEMGLDAQQRAYFTMKLVKGQTLAALLGERPEPGSDRRRFLAIYEQVSQTVAYAHARGVIHRDLKPSNVMVGAFGEVVVLDWGFAKVLAQGGVADERPRDETVVRTRRAGSGSESQAGSILGTPAYMPPEQALGQIEAVDTRSDVFSLGAILCEILTGKPPYAGASADMLLLAAQGRVEDALARLDDCGADGDLVRLAKACLDPMPGKRPRDAGAVAQAVAAYLAGVDERARVAELDAAQARVKALAERRARRLTAGLAAAVVLTLAVGGGGVVWGEGERRARADRTRTDVGRALNEARALYGEAQTTGDPAGWVAALAAAKKAQSLAEAGGLVDSEARDLAARVESERREAERVGTFLARTERIRLYYLGSATERQQAVAEFAAAFREFGIDVEALPDDEVVRLVGESPIGTDLASALEMWAMRMGGVRGGMPDLARRLLNLAKKTDPDPWRCRLRDALLEGDGNALLQLAESPEALKHGPRTPNRIVFGLVEGLSADAEKDRKVEASTRLLRQAQRKWPDDFWLNLRLAAALWALDPPRHDEAAQFFAAAAALNPDFVFGRDVLGRALLLSGKPDEAIETYRGALRVDPGYLSLHGSIAEAHKAKGDLVEVVALWRDEARSAPSDAVAQLVLGEGLFLLDDWPGATAAFAEAVRLKPDAAHAHHELGRALQMTGDIKGAVQAYRDAVRLDASDHYRMNLASALASAGEHDEAIQILEDILRWNPNAHTRMQLGGALRMRGRLDEAVSTLRMALDESPANDRAHYALGLALGDRGDAEEAIREHLAAARLAEDPWWGLTQAAGLLVGQRRFAEAREILEKAIVLEPGRGRAHFLYGLSLLREGRIEEADARLRRAAAARVDPQWQEDFENARRECAFALAAKETIPLILSGERQPKDPIEARDLADLCANLGYHARASEYYAIAVTGPANQPWYRAAYAAAMAGTGQGHDAPGEAGRGALRTAALERLRAALATAEREFAEKPETRETARWIAGRWLRNVAFAGVRGAALDRLPPGEREAWLAFWRDVDAFLARLKQ